VDGTKEEELDESPLFHELLSVNVLTESKRENVLLRPHIICKEIFAYPR
jgi:hypothetical protein